MLQSAGAAGAFTLAHNLFASAAQTPASERITVGAIGISGRGNYILNAFLQYPDVQVVAVCDVIANRREAAKKMVDERYGNQDCRTYIDMRELIAQPDIDAVMIATGDNNHSLISVLAARAGKDIYCEKPLSVTIAESRAVADTVEAAGGKAEINRVGHALFKGRMRREGSMFGGEVSGHYYFRDFYCADSGTIPALLMLELISERGVKLSELLEPYRSTYFISGEINSEVADQQAKMDEIEAMHPDAEITHLDGVSIDYDDWHFNVRPSNTEPLLRLVCEAATPELMAARRDELVALIGPPVAGGH